MTLIALVACALVSQDAKPMPLIHATALALAGGRLYVGTNSGEVHVYDSRTREPVSLLPSERKGIVSCIAASAHGTAWIIGNRPMGIRDKFAGKEDTASQALIFRTPDNRTYTIDLKPAGVSEPVRGLAWFGTRLWMLSDFGSAFYNAKSNAIELGGSFMPKAISEEVARSRIWVKEPYLMTARPASMRRSPSSAGLPFVSQFSVYKFENNRWTSVSGFASNALDVEPTGELSVGEDGKIPPDVPFQMISDTVDFDSTGATAVEGTNLLDAPLFQPNWESKRQSLPGWFGEASRPDPLWVQVQGEEIWIWNGTVLVRQNRAKPGAVAYLSWNDPQMLPNAFLADDEGLWIGTNVGVKRLLKNLPEKPSGFGGFIAVPLGSDTERTDNKTLDKVTKELYRWRFAPADLAGKDGARMVSEVYKAAGIQISASTQGVLNSPIAVPVHDELRIGDVISSSRGLAIYLGNGKTVEMKDGSVKNGTVWDRPFAVARRFVK